MSNYNNAFSEVYTILNYLDSEDYKKIPTDVINVFDKNRNKEYIYEFDVNIDLAKQEMMVETKAILYNLFRDYLCTSNQKEKILKWQEDERKKNEKEKIEKYASKDIFENSKEIDKINTEEKENIQTEMIEYKESIFSRIRKWFINKFI